MRMKRRRRRRKKKKKKKKKQKKKRIIKQRIKGKILQFVLINNHSMKLSNESIMINFMINLYSFIIIFMAQFSPRS